MSLEIKEARVLDVHCPGFKGDGKPCDAPISNADIKSIVDEKVRQCPSRCRSIIHSD